MSFLRDSLSTSPFSLGATLSTSPFSLGATLKKQICSLGEQILSFKSNPKFEVIHFAPLKNENDFLICQRVWKTVKHQGKLREF